MEISGQSVNYLRAASLTKGYIVVFDEKLSANSLLTTEVDVFELTVDEKVLRVYLIGIAD